MYCVLFILAYTDGHVDCFQFVTTTNHAAMNVHTQIFVCTYIFVSLGQIPRSGFARRSGKHHQNITKLFRSGCAILHSYHQCTMVPVSPSPHQHFIRSFQLQSFQWASHCGFIHFINVTYLDLFLYVFASIKTPSTLLHGSICKPPSQLYLHQKVSFTFAYKHHVISTLGWFAEEGEE